MTSVIEPLRFEDGALLVLDQRALPEAEEWIRCETPEQVADCIRTLAVRGAPAIGIAAAYGLALADDREAAAELLRSTRPTAVNLAWALEQCRDAPRPARGGAPAPPRAGRGRPSPVGARRGAVRRGHAGAHALQHRRARDRRATARPAACCARPGSDGRLAEVWVDETRPLLQGSRLTAWELRKAGIPHRVVADSRGGLADGARARGPDRRRARTASRRTATWRTRSAPIRWPCSRTATACRSTWLRRCRRSTRPRRTAPRSRSRSATRPRCVADGDAFNPAFDVTPAELVTAIVTEAGVLEPPYPESIARALAA